MKPIDGDLLIKKIHENFDLDKGYLPIAFEIQVNAMSRLRPDLARLVTEKDFDNPKVDSYGVLPAWVEYNRDDEWKDFWADDEDEWCLLTVEGLNQEGKRFWTSRPTQHQMRTTVWRHDE